MFGFGGRLKRRVEMHDNVETWVLLENNICIYNVYNLYGFQVEMFVEE